MHACIQKSTNTWCTKVIFVQIIIPKLPVCIHILNRNLDTSNNTCIIRKQPNFMQEYVLCSDLLTPSNTLCVCMCVCVCVSLSLSVERERESELCIYRYVSCVGGRVAWLQASACPGGLLHKHLTLAFC